MEYFTVTLPYEVFRKGGVIPQKEREEFENLTPEYVIKSLKKAVKDMKR